MPVVHEICFKAFLMRHQSDGSAPTNTSLCVPTSTRGGCEGSSKSFRQSCIPHQDVWKCSNGLLPQVTYFSGAQLVLQSIQHCALWYSCTLGTQDPVQGSFHTIPKRKDSLSEDIACGSSSLRPMSSAQHSHETCTIMLRMRRRGRLYIYYRFFYPSFYDSLFITYIYFFYLVGNLF